MANTFTGLKLQGEIGKFGTKELSDIEGESLTAYKTLTMFLSLWQISVTSCKMQCWIVMVIPCPQTIVPDSITHIQKAREKNTIFSAIFYIDFDTNRLFQI